MDLEVIKNIQRQMKRGSIIAAVLIFLTFGVAYSAVSVYHKELAGLGILEVTNSVQITNIEIVSETQVDVSVEDTTSTVMGHDYTINLYLQGNLAGSKTVSWSAPLIIKVSFITLDMTDVWTFKVEVLG